MMVAVTRAVGTVIRARQTPSQNERGANADMLSAPTSSNTANREFYGRENGSAVSARAREGRQLLDYV
jgi:hypothetical protein